MTDNLLFFDFISNSRYVNTAIQRLKISGLERRTRWLDEDSNSSKKEEGELK